MRLAPRSLRGRLLGAFGLFALALVVTYAVVLPRLVLTTEDLTFSKQLEERVELAKLELTRGAGLPTDPTGATRFSLDGDGLTAELADWLAGLDAGRHEFNDDARPGTDARELFVAVEPLEDGRRLYVVYDVGRYEGMEGLWDGVYLAALGLGLLVATGAVLVGLLLVRGLSRALGELAAVGRAGALELPPETRRRRDELGDIARSWNRAAVAAREALERERRFTRDASHELRTPVAAARGAVENLRNEGLDPERRRALLDRAERSLDDMADLVTSFLWLARGPEPGPVLDPVPLREVLDPLLEDSRRRAAERGLELEVRGDADPDLGVPAAVAKIVLGNLLRNAVAHADRGTIRVLLEAERVSLTNARPEPDAAPAAESFGFGLTLVEDLCRRFGWRLELDPEAAEGFVARVHLDQNDQVSPTKSPR